MLEGQLRETLRTPGLGWLFGVAALVPLAAVGAGAAVCRLAGIPAPGPLLLRIWFLPAAALVGTVSAAYGAASIAGRVEAGLVDAMQRHGISPDDVLGGKCAASVVLAFALFAATLPAALLIRAFGSVPILDTGFAFLGLGAMAVLAPSVGLGLGARIGRLRPAIIAAVSAMAVVPLALVAYARFAGAAIVGADDWADVVLFGTDASARRLDLYVHLAAPPLLAALAALGLARALAAGALLPRHATPIARPRCAASSRPPWSSRSLPSRSARAREHHRQAAGQHSVIASPSGFAHV